MKKAVTFIALCMCFVFCADAIDTSAKSAILYEANTDSVLYEKNARDKRAIASTTKIMTALLVIENGDLNDTVVIKPEQVGVEGTSLYLKEGEKITVKTLLYGLMLRSGNDAAEALAIYVSGDIASFVDLMNGKAQELGMADSNFENPHGLPNDNHYSSAYDMALLTAYAMKNITFREIVSTKNYTAEGRSFKNHNKLLTMSDDIDGVKTGFTKAAGRCLVSSGEKENMRLVAVTLYDPNDWDDHLKLFDYGFSNFKTRRICAERERLAQLPIAGLGEVNVIAEKSASYTIKSNDELETQIYLPRFCYAPVEKGEQVGELRVIKNDEVIEKIPLIAEKSVQLPQKESFLKRLLNKIKNG